MALLVIANMATKAKMPSPTFQTSTISEPCWKKFGKQIGYSLFPRGPLHKNPNLKKIYETRKKIFPRGPRQLFWPRLDQKFFCRDLWNKLYFRSPSLQIYMTECGSIKILQSLCNIYIIKIFWPFLMNLNFLGIICWFLQL